MRTLLDLPVPLRPVDQQRNSGIALKAIDEKIKADAWIVRATEELRDAMSELLLSGRPSAGA
ncbi:hypothetical protein [Streptomyces griseoluteus]|uniref:hypothetical protein n=1 Tax=Streptomyces griseoluteus TaxID=29306 RepID=UPI0036C1E5E7